jgi:molecular chaperone HscB
MASSVDPFALLGLPRSFDIDHRALQSAYLRGSASLHPDRFANPLEQAQAQRLAAELNQAHAVLADDEQRANLLLRLAGGPEKEQDKSLPDGFLVEMMEIRQEMEGAVSGKDHAARARLEQWARERRAEHIGSVRRMFTALQDRQDASHLREIRRELNAWRYIERMLEQLAEA